MSAHTQSLEALIDALSRLPGVGRKSATRMAFYLLRQPADCGGARHDSLLRGLPEFV